MLVNRAERGGWSGLTLGDGARIMDISNCRWRRPQQSVCGAPKYVWEESRSGAPVLSWPQEEVVMEIGGGAPSQAATTGWNPSSRNLTHGTGNFNNGSPP